MHKQGHWEERDGKRIEDDGRGRRDRRTDKKSNKRPMGKGYTNWSKEKHEME